VGLVWFIDLLLKVGCGCGRWWGEMCDDVFFLAFQKGHSEKLREKGFRNNF